VLAGKEPAAVDSYHAVAAVARKDLWSQPLFACFLPCSCSSAVLAGKDRKIKRFYSDVDVKKHNVKRGDINSLIHSVI